MGSGHRSSRRRGRSVESAAIWAFIPLAALTPLWLVAMFLWWLPVRWLIEVPFTWWAGGYLLGSVVLFLKPVQRHVFTRVLGTRSPTPGEFEHLGPAWRLVAQSCGVAPDRFVLSVVDDEELNAFACGGHLLVVSSFAIRELPTDELTGVLAHELAHHLGSHTVALTIGQWMTLPIVALARIGWFVHNVATAATTAFTRRSSAAEACGQVMSSLLRLPASALTAGLAAATVLGHAVGRGAEFQADRRAAEMGFGRELGRALRRALRLTPRPTERTRIQRLTTSHPPLRTRAARLDAYLRRGHHPSMGPLSDD